MNSKALKVLEFDKIIDLLKSKASSSLGMRYIEKLTPSSDFNEVKSRLEETSEAQAILIKRGFVGLQGIYDIEDKVKRASVGAALDPGSLLMIGNTLRVARMLSNNLASSEEEDFNYPIIQSLSNSLYTYRDLEEDELNEECTIDNEKYSYCRLIDVNTLIMKNYYETSETNGEGNKDLINNLTKKSMLEDEIMIYRKNNVIYAKVINKKSEM